MKQAKVAIQPDQHLLTLPGEQLLLFTKRHWLSPVQAISLMALMGLFLFLLIVASYYFFEFSLLLVLGSMLVISCLGLTLIAKVLADWNFHVYIVTTKRLAEICYIPLKTHYVNEILMDQVNCTEVDVKRDGLIRHIFDFGSVAITFDRPTHDEQFVFWEVAHPRNIGSLLTNRSITSSKTDLNNAVWFKRDNGEKSGFFIPKEVFPRLSI